MLKFSLTTVLLIVFCTLRAQMPVSLAGTGWKGTMAVPDPTLCILKFKKDTVKLLYADAATVQMSNGQGGQHPVSGNDSASIEDMVYQLHADTLWLTKIQGGSPCSTTEPGVYKVKIVKDKMNFTVIKDPCDVRVNALQVELTKLW